MSRSGWSPASLLTVCLCCTNPMLPEIERATEIWPTTSCPCSVSTETHQVGAHGALCQHKRTFRHQEDLNVRKARSLLLAVILLRVVGTAPLCADLVFNLHPSAQAPVGLDGMKLNGFSPAESIWLWWRAALQNKCESLRVTSASRLQYTARNTAVHSALRTVRQRPLFSKRVSSTSYLNTEATHVYIWPFPVPEVELQDAVSSHPGCQATCHWRRLVLVSQLGFNPQLCVPQAVCYYAPPIHKPKQDERCVISLPRSLPLYSSPPPSAPTCFTTSSSYLRAPSA